MKIFRLPKVFSVRAPIFVVCLEVWDKTRDLRWAGDDRQGENEPLPHGQARECEHNSSPKDFHLSASATPYVDAGSRSRAGRSLEGMRS